MTMENISNKISDHLGKLIRVTSIFLHVPFVFYPAGERTSSGELHGEVKVTF